MDLPSFDEMLRLAQTSPDKLEALRQQLIEETIASAPEGYSRRLRGLQFQIDMERRRSKTPMASCIRISKMMHDHLHQLKDSINGYPAEHASYSAPVESQPVEVASNLIAFPDMANSAHR